MYSEAIEDYLKALYKIEEQASSVSTDALAEALNIKQSSVTNMLKKLADMGLIQYRPYQGATLTDTGRKDALRVLRHHRLVELFLVQILGLSWDQVHEEAEKWEHVLSPTLVSRIEAMLGHPTTDPHGAPIPGQDGTIVHQDCILLAELQPGQTAVIVEVNDADPELLRYCAALGLRPGVEVALIQTGPLGDWISICLNECEHSLGRQVAEHVQVRVKS